MPEQYDILGCKVHIYKRPNNSHWQCSSYFAGKNRRTSTKEDSISKAKEIAEDWYLQLRGKVRNGEIKTEKTFAKPLKPNVPLKNGAAQLWCEKMSTTKYGKWRYLFAQQLKLEKALSKGITTFAELASNLGE